MKRYYIIAALFLTLNSFAQQIPANLKTAVYTNRSTDTILQPKLSPNLAYYSKNYKAVFGQYQYTLNSTAFSNTKNIYVAPDDKFYNVAGNPFVTGMPFAGDTVWPDAYGKGAFVSGVISMLLGENLTNLEKYLTWNITK